MASTAAANISSTVVELMHIFPRSTHTYSPQSEHGTSWQMGLWAGPIGNDLPFRSSDAKGTAHGTSKEAARCIGPKNKLALRSAAADSRGVSIPHRLILGHRHPAEAYFAHRTLLRNSHQHQPVLRKLCAASRVTDATSPRPSLSPASSCPARTRSWANRPTAPAFSLAPTHVTVSRLPRLPTDQTASVTPVDVADPIETMLPIVDEEQSWRR